jgi:hypothetical protein
MGYGLWAMGYGLWAMGDGRWEMGDGLRSEERLLFKLFTNDTLSSQ